MEGDYDPDCRRCMPWNDIKLGKYDDRIEFIKQLISLRKNEHILKSRNFHFTNEYKNKRVLEYIKLDDFNNKIQIIVNCSEEDVEIQNEGKVLFSNLYEKNILKRNGVIISKIIE